MEEVIKELKTNPGFAAYVIMNNDGEQKEIENSKQSLFFTTWSQLRQNGLNLCLTLNPETPGPDPLP